MIVTLEGFPAEFLITPGSVADIKALKMFQFSFEKGSKIYVDGAYNDYCFETGLERALGVELVPKRKKIA